MSDFQVGKGDSPCATLRKHYFSLRHLATPNFPCSRAGAVWSEGNEITVWALGHSAQWRMRDTPDGVLPINVSRVVRKMVASNIHLTGFGHDHYGSAKCISGREQAPYAGNVEVLKKPQSRTTDQNGVSSALESCLWRLSWVRFYGYLFVGRISLSKTD